MRGGGEDVFLEVLEADFPRDVIEDPHEFIRHDLYIISL
jgi:hypothetical protein